MLALVKKVLLQHSQAYLFQIIYASFGDTMAET